MSNPRPGDLVQTGASVQGYTPRCRDMALWVAAVCAARNRFPGSQRLDLCDPSQQCSLSRGAILTHPTRNLVLAMRRVFTQ